MNLGLIGVISCNHSIAKPPVKIQAPGYFLFVEGGQNLEDVLTVVNGDLEFNCSGPDTGYCTLTGQGQVLIHGHRCTLSPDRLSCNGDPLDLSLGGVLIRDDGSIVPVNPLPMLAH